MAELKVQSYNPLAVTACILLADGILFALIYFGQDHQLNGPDNPPSICPRIDHYVALLSLKSAAVIVHVVTAFLAIYLNSKPRWRDGMNVLLLIETILFSGWWTAHTGGLSRSLYGSGFLAWFPVATLVPRSTWVKVTGGATVAAVALILALWAPEHNREVFIWVSSIVACTIGWLIQRFLAKLKAPNCQCQCVSSTECPCHPQIINLPVK